MIGFEPIFAVFVRRMTDPMMWWGVFLVDQSRQPSKVRACFT